MACLTVHLDQTSLEGPTVVHYWPFYETIPHYLLYKIAVLYGGSWIWSIWDHLLYNSHILQQGEF